MEKKKEFFVLCVCVCFNVSVISETKRKKSSFFFISSVVNYYHVFFFLLPSYII